MGFDPISMAMIGGTVMQGVSQVAGGKSANAAAQFNAKAQEAAADQLDTQTAERVASTRRSFDKFRGALRGDMAAYGGSSSGGTGLMLAQEAARQAKLDELNVITEGANQAGAMRTGAEITRYEGKARQRQAIMGGLGTALSGFANYKSVRS
ncbi:hypothetical protein ATO8_19809 [Roseivivax marinus]|uniref:Uncharacterized protein n=1 Tax=Roseivivax marinus TaxID=1379903 RepID=W4HDP8_9RHOB|nr:hypothetical protein [Roseivivax marinus]ETW10877.1 hypothetical protein ATO8_19809 [Roseivivax marinus]